MPTPQQSKPIEGAISMRRSRLLLLVIAGLFLTGCSTQRTATPQDTQSTAASTMDSQLISCDASWACLSQVADLVGHPVWAPAEDREVVVDATVDRDPSTSSRRVNYIWLTSSGAKVSVYGTTGTYFPTNAATSTGAAITVQGSAASLTSSDPEHAVVSWSQDEWTWQVGAIGPSASDTATGEAENLLATTA